MRIRNLVCNAACLSLLAFIAGPSYGQLLYSENFDDGNAVTRWRANPGIGFPIVNEELGSAEPLDTNFDTSFPPDGVTDDTSGFAFDYSAHGIPPAPNGSDPNSTIGLQLKANLFSNLLGGFSASPDPNGANPLDLTGDYSITFDYWGSSIGDFPFGGSSATMRSTFGLLTAGTVSQSILSADGVFFGVVADGGSPSDYTVYSAARDFSHQCAVSQFLDPCDPNWSDPIDLQATYHADGRDSETVGSALYKLATGTDPNSIVPELTVPQSVIDAAATFGADLTGPLWPGAAGFQWHQMEIRKEGNIIDLHMNGFKLMTMNITDWFDPNTPAGDPNSLGEPPYPNGTITPGGGNISFGHTDTNAGGPDTDPAREFVYTLIDNIEVNAIVAVFDADFDDSGFVDGLDFLAWQQNSGLIGGALNADGDANGDGNVDAADLAIWESQYGSPPPLSAVSAVPEPTTLFSWITFSLFTLLGCRTCRQTAKICPG